MEYSPSKLAIVTLISDAIYIIAINIVNDLSSPIIVIDNLTLDTGNN
jgi:hypothetical protein